MLHAHGRLLLFDVFAPRGDVLVLAEGVAQPGDDLMLDPAAKAHVEGGIHLKAEGARRAQVRLVAQALAIEDETVHVEKYCLKRTHSPGSFASKEVK